MFKKITDKFYGLTTNMKPVTKKKLISSYISLFLAFVVLITTTISWFTIVDTATVHSDVFTMHSSSGLRVNEGADISNHIILDNVYLYESSSVDGRNMFFPTKDTFSSNTSSMIFREGTAGDCNQTYIHKDFTLYGDSAVTHIYVKSYNITVDKQVFNGSTEITYDSSGKPVAQVKKQECPVRIAFISDSADEPVVIDPTALVDSHVKNYNAVKSVYDGVPSTEKTDASSFSNHYFSYNDPLFELIGTEPLDVTMVVWLEGTGGNCDEYAGKEISIDIELESNYSDTEIIYFVDDTLPDNAGATEDGWTWINGSGDCIVTMAYDVPDDKTDDPNDKITKTVVMNAVSDTKWYAPLPKDVTTDIAFYRYSLTDEIIYNAWYTRASVNNETSSKVKSWLSSEFSAYGGALQTDRGSSLTYTAKRGNGYSTTTVESERLSPCIGFWDYTGSSSGGGSSGGGGTTTGDITINATLKDCTSSGWVYSNANAHDSLYIVFDDGTSYKMSATANKYFSKTEIPASGSTKLKGFEMRNNAGTTYRTFYLSSSISIANNTWYNFEIDYQDKLNKI